MTSLETVKRYARERESERRYLHTCGVAADCGRLAEIFELDKATSQKIVAAGWLHDTTKELSPAGQKDLCEKFGIPEPPNGFGSPTLHAITAAYLTRETFPDLVDDTVFSAIRYHTTGNADMSLTDMLVCFADYTEQSRKYETCRRLRAKFYENVTADNRERLLRECLAEAFDSTISSLTSRGDHIDPETYDARDRLCETLKKQEVQNG